MLSPQSYLSRSNCVPLKAAENSFHTYSNSLLFLSELKVLATISSVQKAAIFPLQHHLRIALPAWLLFDSPPSFPEWLCCGERSGAEHWHHIQKLVVAQLLYHQEVLSLSKWPPHFPKIMIELLGSSFDRFICSRVGACGSEMSDRKNRDKKKYTKI